MVYIKTLKTPLWTLNSNDAEQLRSDNKILLLPLARIEARRPLREEFARRKTTTSQMRANAFSYTPQWQFCYGIPLSIMHLWLGATNLRPAFRNMIHNQGHTMPRILPTSLDALEHFYGDLHEYDYVLDGMCIMAKDGQPDYEIRLWDTRSERIAIKLTSRENGDEPATNLNNLVSDLTNALPQDIALELRDGALDYLGALLGHFGMRSLCGYYAQLFLCRDEWENPQAYISTEQDAARKLSQFQKVAFDFAAVLDFTASYFAALSFTKTRYPLLVKSHAQAVRTVINSPGCNQEILELAAELER